LKAVGLRVIARYTRECIMFNISSWSKIVLLDALEQLMLFVGTLMYLEQKIVALYHNL
jgi:hypothetical protein